MVCVIHLKRHFFDGTLKGKISNWVYGQCLSLETLLWLRSCNVVTPTKVKESKNCSMGYV